jgi:hypothetical protein
MRYEILYRPKAAIQTIDSAFEGFSQCASYARNKLEKDELSPAQLKRLVKLCASDMVRMNAIWRMLREHLVNSIK